jgi:hypothetical protein
MNWLEHPQDEAERIVREGLDLAALRTGDEITHRRVWSKVADALVMPEPRVSGRLVLLAGSAAVALLAVAGVIAYPYLGGRTPQMASPAPSKTTVEPSVPTDQLAVDESARAPGNVIRTHKGERLRVALGGGAVADLDQESAITWDAQHRPSIQQGTAALSVPHQPPGWRFSVTAGPYVVTVVGTKFKVEVGGKTVGVDVSEGIVEVSRGSQTTRLVAGDAWRGPLVPEESSAKAPSAPAGASAATAPSERPRAASRMPSLSPSKPVAPVSRRLQDAQSALQSGDVNRAMDILAQTSQGSGPAAENAAYELARITRYNLGKPRQAVALWEKYRTRFPSGILRSETDLSIVDTLSQLGEVQSALTEAKTFLARHPNSERRQEVQRLIDRLHAAEASSETR